MSQSNAGAKKRSPIDTSEQSDTNSDVFPAPDDLSAFRIHVLVTIGAADGPIYGLAIKERLSDYYGTEINHGRLYPNLDDLADMGLVDKGARDRRTNEYQLTETGIRVLEALGERIAGAARAASGDETLVTDGSGHPCEEEMLDVELVLGAGRLYDHQVRLDVTSSAVVDREEGRLELSLADGEMDEYLAELGLKNRTDSQEDA